jgi:transposase-like protein
MRSIPNLPAVRAEALRLYRDESLSLSKIAETVGVDRTTVVQWARKAEMPKRDKFATWPDEVREAALSELRAGASTGDVAAKHGVPLQTLRAWARAEGVKTKTGRPKPHADLVAKAQAMREAGHRVEEIAVKLGIAYRTAKRWTSNEGRSRPAMAMFPVPLALGERISTAARARHMAPKELARRLLAAVLTPDERGRDMVDALLEDA